MNLVQPISGCMDVHNGPKELAASAAGRKILITLMEVMGAETAETSSQANVSGR